MRILVFGHDANPAIDTPLCKKSGYYVAQLIEEGRAYMVSERVCQLFPPKNLERDRREADDTGLAGTTAAISVDEMRLNVGECDPMTLFGTIRRAQQKVRAYPHVFDTSAALARGSWVVRPIAIAVQSA
jgi:hypothetical protein